MMLTGTYDLNLVALSFIVAIIASFTALELSARVARHSGRAAAGWLVAGSFSMGVGIWTMHFVGMLAFKMRLPFTYDVPITILSLFVGIFASAFAIWVASRKTTSLSKIGFSGLVLGAGIATMHYTGMAAMRMQGRIIYEPAIVFLSILVAVVAATAAIWIIFTLIRHKSDDRHLLLLKFAAATIMGLAIGGMHYIAMAAASYEPFPNAYLLADPQSNPAMGTVLAFAALIILGLTHLTIFFDVRITAEQARGRAAQLHASQLSELLDESLNEIFVVDLATLRFVNVNKGACEHLGYRREDLKAMSPMDITPGLTEDRLRTRFKQLAESTERHTAFEGTHRRADGSTYPVEINMQLSDVLGRPVALAIVSDISKRKALEDELVQAKKLESIGQLAAGIAHEINTPAQYVGDNTRFIQETMTELMQLVGALQKLYVANRNDRVTAELIDECGELIKTVDPEYLAEEVPAAIEQTLDGITRISKIVRAMKEFSHPGSTSQELVNLNKTAQNTITVASNEWKYVADVETNFDPNLPAVPCMPQEISQVVLNLIVNAAHAIEDSLEEGSTAKGTITVSTGFDDNRAEIRIADTGSGIPKHARERIFDPFFTTKEVGKGTGQGLSMAYRTIVNGHNGNLSFETSEGHGTTFIISLPLEATINEAEESAA